MIFGILCGICIYIFIRYVIIKKIFNKDIGFENIEKIFSWFVCILFILLLFLFKLDMSDLVLTKIARLSFWEQYLDLLFYSFFAVIFLIAYRKLFVKAFKDMLFHIDEYIKYFALFFVITVASMVVFAIILSMLSVGESANQVTINQSKEIYKLETVLTACLIGPFVEEMVFRGTIYEALRKERRSISRIIVDILVIGLIFGLYHCDFAYVFSGGYEEVVSCIPVMVMGIGVTALYEKTGNILCPIMLHIAINALSILG